MAQTKYKLVIEAVNRTKKAFAAVKGGLGKIGGAAKSAAKVVGGIGLAVAAVAVAFVAMGKKAFDALDSIGKTASRTGFAAESLQALRLAAVESGGTVEDLNKAIEKFSKNIGDVLVKGTGEATYALDRMGVSLFDSSGVLKSNDQILREVSEGLKNMGSGFEKNSALMAFFGKAGTKLNQVFAEGAEGLDRWVTKAEEMGFIVSGTAIKAVEAFNDRFAELKFMLDGLVKQTFAALAPGLEKIVTQFKDWATNTQKSGRNLEDLGKIIAEKLVESFAVLIETIGLVGKAIIDFANKTGYHLTKLAIPFAMLNRDFAKAQELWDQTRVPPALSDFDVKMNKLADSVRKFFEETNNAKDGTDELKDKIKEITPLFPELTKAVDGFSVGFEGVFKNSATTLTKFTKLGEKVGKTLEDGLVDAFMNIRKGAEGLKDVMDSILKMILTELIRVFIVQAAITAVKSWWTGREHGGPVSAGKPYLVGEKGPELFVPGSSGGIVPNNQLAAAGGATNVNISYNITAFDAQSATVAIAAQAPTILGIVEQSFRKRGRRGPLGP